MRRPEPELSDRDAAALWVGALIIFAFIVIADRIVAGLAASGVQP